MTLLYASSMDHYGPGLAPGNATSTSNPRWWDMSATDILGDGWAYAPTMGSPGASIKANGNLDLKAPSWGARQGDYALVADAMEMSFAGTGSNNSVTYTVQGTECLPLTIPGATNAHRLIQFAFGCSSLPTNEFFQGNICHFMLASGVVAFTLAVNPSGRLTINSFGVTTAAGTGGSSAAATTTTELATSASPVISPNTWYNLCIDLTYNSGAGTVTIAIYVDDISAGSLVLSSTFTPTNAGNIDTLGFLPASIKGGGDAFTDTSQRAVRDIIVMDDTGTYNNALIGQAFVSALETRLEDGGGGWTAYPRHDFTDGVLNCYTTQGGLYVASNVAHDLGSGDFTVETMWRPSALPAASTGYESLIMGKWDEANNRRSYRLTYDGVSAKLRWEISTDGTNPVTIAEIPWVPDLNKWVHVAVSRAASVTRLFINGIQQGVDVSDANTYYAGAAPLSIFGRFEGTTTLIANTSFSGFADETRLTVGVGRYTAEFTPPSTIFGRNTTDDPSYASVTLLMGYESGAIIDESSGVYTVNNNGALTADTPADNLYSYSVLNQRPGWDDTGIEAAQTFATGRFTFTGLPVAAETMTIGATTYTWVGTLTGAANEILIGATTADCISNAIAAINAGAGAGTVYGTGTVANASVVAAVLEDPQFDLVAITIGAAGNTVATTETMTNGSFHDATLTGGQDIPAYSQFSMERLPVTVTGVAAVQFTARANKTDAGSAKLQLDLIGPSAGVGAGTAQNVDLNAAWLRQIFEVDPDTSAALTPSTLVGGRVRANRTV